MSTSRSSIHASRREFLTAAGAATIAAASCSSAQGNAQRATTPGTPAAGQALVGDGSKRRILLRGGVVLTLDAKIGDFEKADVLIDGKRIAQIAPSITAADAEVVEGEAKALVHRNCAGGCGTKGAVTMRVIRHREPVPFA